jgi:hypothetical protein
MQRIDAQRQEQPACGESYANGHNQSRREFQVILHGGYDAAPKELKSQDSTVK